MKGIEIFVERINSIIRSYLMSRHLLPQVIISSTSLFGDCDVVLLTSDRLMFFHGKMPEVEAITN